MEEINVHKAKASVFFFLEHSWENLMIMLSSMQANSSESGRLFLQKLQLHKDFRHRKKTPLLETVKTQIDM